MKIELVTSGINVVPMLWALQEHPELWDANNARTVGITSPHFGTNDIWCRWMKDGSLREDGSHESVWFPASAVLPVRQLCYATMAQVGGERLGGVLITRIPARQSVKPHTDSGWHAGYYEKFAVQIASHPRQAFMFHGESLVTKPGDLFRFDNSHEHWVTNDSDEARITLIICIRR
jgi:hypothetical protein